MHYTMLEHSIGRWGITFIDPAFQASAGFSIVRRIAIFLWAGPLINHILAHPCWDLVFMVHESFSMYCTL